MFAAVSMILNREIGFKKTVKFLGGKSGYELIYIFFVKKSFLNQLSLKLSIHHPQFRWDC